MPESARIVILAGLPGVGKSRGASVFKESGWLVVSAGDVIRDMCSEAGLPLDRKSLQQFGLDVLDSKGDEYFANVILGKIRGVEKVVIEGIRPLRVVELIKNEVDCIVAYISSSKLIRYERLREKDGIEYEEFLLLEESEIEKKSLCIESIADVVIFNGSSLGKFISEMRFLENLATLESADLSGGY